MTDNHPGKTALSIAKEMSAGLPDWKSVRMPAADVREMVAYVEELERLVALLPSTPEAAASGGGYNPYNS